MMDESKIDIISGTPIYHSKDKKKVCYTGREKIFAFNKVTLVLPEFSDHQEKLQRLSIASNNDIPIQMRIRNRSDNRYNNQAMTRPTKRLGLLFQTQFCV